MIRTASRDERITEAISSAHAEAEERKTAPPCRPYAGTGTTGGATTSAEVTLRARLEAPWQAGQVPDGEQDDPADEHDGHVREHQRDDRSDAGVLLVLHRERHDQ